MTQKRWTSWQRWKRSCMSKMQASAFSCPVGDSTRSSPVFRRLSEMMTKPRNMGNLRVARLARYLVGTHKVTLRFDHQEYGDIVRIPVDSDLAGSEESYSTHAGLEFHGGHLVDSWVASDRVSPEFRRARAPRNRGWLEESSRSTCTRRWDEPSTSMSRRTRRQRSGCAPERALKDRIHPSSIAVDPRRHS